MSVIGPSPVPVSIKGTVPASGEVNRQDGRAVTRHKARYRTEPRRWSGEVDIRAIKATMQRDVLRCKTPEMVEEEIWAHLLAYNLLRTVMAVAAAEVGIEPREVSFKGAKQAVTAFAPKLEAARPCDRPALIDALLRLVAYHRVGDRPGRWEPRALKRRPKPRARLG